MSHVQAVQEQLLKHLRLHLPILHEHVYLSPQSCSHIPLNSIKTSRTLSSSCSLWLHGPSYTHNVWASCLPDPVVRQGNQFTRYHAAIAYDLLYEVLLLSRCNSSLSTAATQLCSCVRYACSLEVPLSPQPDTSSSRGQERNHNTATHQKSRTTISKDPRAHYELCWGTPMLSHSIVNTSGWHTLTGSLKVEGVLLDNDQIAQQGVITSKSVQIVGGRTHNSSKLPYLGVSFP